MVNEDNIGLYDKTLGTIFEGVKSVFDYSNSLVKNENGDFLYSPNKTELKQQKVQDGYDTSNATLYGLVSVASEYLTRKFLRSLLRE